MAAQTTLANISGLIRAKRREEGIGLREAGRKSGVSPSTLSRLERGTSETLPDLDTLNQIADWLKMPLSALLGEKGEKRCKKGPELGTLEQIQVSLRADKNLSPETAHALFQSFQILYQQFTGQDLKGKASAKGKM